MSTVSAPFQVDDPINVRILAVSEDRLQGFQRDPFGEIARLSGVAVEEVIERVRAMLAAGTIRRVRQTLMSTNLAAGALAAWLALAALKREFALDELVRDLWQARADEAELPIGTFCEIAASLNQRGVIGRFSTFLEHVKPLADGQRVTRYNALFHWAVPPGREIEAGREVGRHDILTHAYWREGGPEFRNVNIMAVAHGTDRDLVLAHKAAIDRHLA